MRVKTGMDEQGETVALDHEALEEVIEQRRRDLALARRNAATSTDPADHSAGILAREVARLGELLRLSGRHDESAALLGEAVGLWEGLGRGRASFMARMRLAEVWRRQGSLQASAEALDALVLEARQQDELVIYLDFALYERALTAWRAGHHPRAIDALEEALTLRSARSSGGLVEETTRVLEAVRASAATHA